jgi:arylsulfatase A-like enzyme/Tfp pilus assembly protein PilF
VVSWIWVVAGCARSVPQVDLHAIPNQNVLLITIDTLRADALGTYGGRAATPALDQLAAEGVRFDFAHAHAVVTLTSHASILTGQYPFQHGLRDNSGYRLAATVPTLATRLKDAGYATAAFVAAFPLHSRFGLNRGFDGYDDRFGETHAPTEFAMPERSAAVVVPLARGWIAAHSAPSTSTQHAAPSTQHPPAPGTSTQHAAPSTQHPPAPGTSTQHAAPSTQHPWFVWLHAFDPHAPYVPSYQGEVEKVDAALAPLLDDVRALAKPTLVVLTSDHGESLGEHGEQAHGLFAYEATLRVPLIIAPLGGASNPARREPASGVRRPGEISVVHARHIDLLPTILAAIGQPVPGDLPGRSLLEASERAPNSGAAPRPTYFEAMSGMLNRGSAPLTGVLVDYEKFIDLPIPERYNLATDGGERVNLAGRAPEQDRTLEAVLRGYRAPLPGTRLIESPEAAERLRTLGYASGSAASKATYTEADDPKKIVELDRLMHSAVEAAGAGRVADAIQIYQQVIARRPDFPIAYRHLAFLEWQRGNVNGGIMVLQRALAAGVRQPAIVAQLGGYLADAGRVGQGIQLLEPLIADPYADADTLNTLGIAYARSGRAADAQRLFERVLTINPSSSVPQENLGLLALERGDLATAKTRFEAAVSADPRSSRGYSGIGVVALREGNRGAAIAAWTRAVELDRTNFDALYNLATTLVRDGQRQRAQPYLEAFLKNAPPAYERDKREVSRLIQQR